MLNGKFFLKVRARVFAKIYKKIKQYFITPTADSKVIYNQIENTRFILSIQRQHLLGILMLL